MMKHLHLATAGFGYTRAACGYLAQKGQDYVPTTHDWTIVDCPECQTLIDVANVVSRLAGRQKPFIEWPQKNGTVVIPVHKTETEQERQLFPTQTWLIKSQPGIRGFIARLKAWYHGTLNLSDV